MGRPFRAAPERQRGFRKETEQRRCRRSLAEPHAPPGLSPQVTGVDRQDFWKKSLTKSLSRHDRGPLTWSGARYDLPFIRTYVKDMPTRGKAYEWACCGRTGLFHRDLVNEEEARGPAAGMPGGFGSVGEGIYLYVACSGLREGDCVVGDTVRVVRVRDRYGYFPCRVT